jgi:hypothetical protein
MPVVIDSLHLVNTSPMDGLGKGFFTNSRKIHIAFPVIP